MTSDKKVDFLLEKNALRKIFMLNSKKKVNAQDLIFSFNIIFVIVKHSGPNFKIRPINWKFFDSGLFFQTHLRVFKNQITKVQKKNFLVDPDRTKVRSFRGFEGPKVIFFNFLVPRLNFFLFVFNIETNGSSYQIKNKNDRKLIKNFFKLLWKWILTKIDHFQQGVLLKPNVQK